MGSSSTTAVGALPALALTFLSTLGCSSSEETGPGATDGGATAADSQAADVLVEAGPPVLDASSMGGAWSLDDEAWIGAPRCQKAGDSWVILVASSTPAGGGIVLTFPTKPTANGAYLAEAAGVPSGSNRVVVNTTRSIEGSPVGFLAASGTVDVTLDGAQVKATYTALPSNPVGRSETGSASGILICP